jgi:thiol-disulfide isomerase/thioredoxin
MVHARRIAASALLAMLVTAAGRAAEPGDAMPTCAPLAEAIAAADARFDDKVLLIDFWATWCPPCRLAMPQLDTLRKSRATEGFEVLAINVDEDVDAASRYLSERPVSYPVLHDPAGDCPRSFGLEAMPSTYVIDRARRVHAVHLGFRRGDEAALRDLVDAALKP